jgi:hypothetical protein
VTTSTTITISSTTTIAAPAGFTPIQAEPGYHAKRNAVVAKRDALVARNAKVADVPAVKAKNANIVVTSTHYPTSVSCEKLITRYTVSTVTNTAKITSSSTLTAVTTFTTSTTSTTVTSTSTLADATVRKVKLSFSIALTKYHFYSSSRSLLFRSLFQLPSPPLPALP